MRLKFASYNIHKAVGTDRRRDPDRIITVLREMDADIIALQEADRRVGERASVLERAALDDSPWKVLDVAKRPRSIGWHGNAILVRRTFTVLDAEPIDLPTLEPRGAARGDLEIDGARIRVVGMHLDLSGLRRRDQIKAVIGHVDACEPRCPTVLMGDFNQWGNQTGAMQEFRRHWHVLDTGRSFPSRQPIARLDRIVTSDEWGCLEQHVHHSATASQASDHLPIVAELELPDLQASPNY
ncbi:endonuclease/exonuclease/phosphatase family protein [Pontixanthobacter aestiaquae]|uniref:Endonuclease n=1 Tax=Pontixanthobacter aestiaquae TaxID=1509367 RepID=A0A844Z1Z9_9SPHN|nr:endonuclease/exonuclease/phosphatase family protein [Pontixanthobacter aestiaquae]MDN3647057.1 endonuclease/exonuclease/phosphatase family protein [Pontixanthobacter aestiaquae]MXO81965.1 endonuclease [Pontixanthobacter aestiaquae]